MSNLIPRSNQSLSTQRASEPQTASAVMPRIDFAEIFRAMRRRWWLPVLCGLLVAGLVWWQVSKLPVLYESTGSINVKTSEPVIFQGAVGTEDSKDLEQMITVEQGLHSSTVLLKLVEKYKLAEDPSYIKGGTSAHALLATLMSRVKIELRKGSRLIDLTVLDTDPKRAAMMVEDLVQEYEAWKNSGRAELIAKTSMGLEAEEQRLRAQLEKSEKSLQEFRDKNPVLNLNGTDGNQVSSNFEMLSRELTEATSERLRLEAEYKAMADAQNPDKRTLAAKGEQSQLILQLESQLATLEAEFAQLKTRYKEKHPSYIELKDRITQVKEQIALIAEQAGESLKNRYQLALQQQERLAKLVVEAKQNALSEDILREKYTNLSRTVESDRELHTRVATQLQEIQINSSLSSSVLRWEAHPLVADWPKSPRKSLYTAAGMILGGFFGVFLGLLIELLDRKVREGSAVERAIHVPQLASLPDYDRETIQGLSVSGAISKDRVRSLHMSRFTFTPRPETEEMEAVMFASTFDGDGKTICVLKCARTLVKQGYRTLIIDADLHREGLSRLYAQNGRARLGLTAYLSGEAEAAEVLFETGLPGLWFLPSGMVNGSPSDYLAGAGLKKLLEAVRPMFDRVVFDVSSIEESDDVQAIARHVSATYFVARKGVGKYRDLKASMETLRAAGARVVGFIWNEGGGRKWRMLEGPVVEPLRLIEEQGRWEAEVRKEAKDRAAG